MKDKIKNYLIKHKISLSILIGILIIAVIVAHITLESTYNYIIKAYEEDPTSIQACEDGIKTLSKMKYYKNSKNYITQMKRSIVENYCQLNDFEKAKMYLDRNYEESLSDMYSYIGKAKLEYEEAERIKYNESVEGRTKRVKKMYKLMGLGGTDQASYIVDDLASKLEFGSLDDIGYVLPVWNRNELYLTMLKNSFHRGQGFTAGNSVSNYYLSKYEVDETTEVTPEQFQNYLKYTYDIDIDIQAIGVFDYTLSERTDWGSRGFGNKMLVFATDNKWFFGGIFSADSQTWMINTNVRSLIPGDNEYKGQLIEGD